MTHHSPTRPMLAFPMLKPDGPDDSPLVQAFHFAAQKWAREQEAHGEAREQERKHAPQSVIDAADRACTFAENETERAMEMLFEEYRMERARLDRLETLSSERLTA